MPIIINNENDSIEDTLKKHRNDAMIAWNNFLDYLNKKIPKTKDRTEDNIKNEWQNFFEKDENVPYAPTEKILDYLYNDWISHIEENKDIIAAGKENIESKINNATLDLAESININIKNKDNESKEKVLDNSSDEASKAWENFINYYEEKYPNPSDRTVANIKNEYQNFFEKDENVPYAPTELILDKMLNDWIKEIETNPEAVKNGGKSINDKTNTAINEVKKDVTKEEENDDNEEELESDIEKVISFGSKASAITVSDVQKELLNTPFAVPYITSYQKTVVDGKEVISSAVLKRYYSSIDAEIYFGHEYVDDVCNIDWSIQQKTMPLYGYNSYKYDEVAQGNRIVSGTFDINFTSPNYLFKILKAASKVEGAINYGNQNNFRTEMPNNIKAASIDNTLTTYNHKGYQLAPIYNTSFDIDVVFGNYKDQEGGTPVHIILEDVWIQASSMVLSASAAESPPTIRERYSFIARDIRTYVGTVTKEEQKGYNRKNNNYSKNGKKKSSGNSNSSYSKQTEKLKQLIGKTVSGNVNNVHDGDTAKVILDDGTWITIRYDFIDCPEASENVGYQAYADICTKKMRELIDQKRVDVKVKDVDGYGRVVGEVFIDGMSTNEYMLKNGLAFWNEEYDNSEDRDKHRQWEAEAKAAGLGIWDGKEEVLLPSPFRHRKDNEKEPDPESAYTDNSGKTRYSRYLIGFGFGDLSQGLQIARKKAIDGAYFSCGGKKYAKTCQGTILEEGEEDKYNYYVKMKITSWTGRTPEDSKYLDEMENM